MNILQDKQMQHIFKYLNKTMVSQQTNFGMNIQKILKVNELIEKQTLAKSATQLLHQTKESSKAFISK